MKHSSKIYLFFTSLLFLFAPLSLGLASIYFPDSEDNIHLQGIVINLGLLAILALIMFLLKVRKKLSYPNVSEMKYLLFGFISNIIIFFYVFQNSLNIEKEMTVYLIILIILLLYFFIIDKKTIIKELWIFSVWFLVVDTIHYQVYFQERYLFPVTEVESGFLLTTFYLSIPILALVLYVYNMKKYKVIDTFTVISIGIVSLTLLLFFNVVDMNSEFIMTINLILPFVLITDFITMLIYKRFNPLKITFYLRLYTIMVLIFIYSESDYFIQTSFIHERLYEMVGIIYVAIIANFIVFLFPAKEKITEEIAEKIVEEVIETKETILSIDLNTLTITTLKALAKSKGIIGYTKLEKEEIIKLLR
jgi:hypothetical protein